MHKGFFLVLFCLSSSFINCAVEQRPRDVLLALSQEQQQEFNAIVVEEENCLRRRALQEEQTERNDLLLDECRAMTCQQVKAKADQRQQRLCGFTTEERLARQEIVDSREDSLNQIKQLHQVEWLGVLQRTIKGLQRKTGKQDNQLKGLQIKTREQDDQLREQDDQLKELQRKKREQDEQLNGLNCLNNTELQFLKDSNNALVKQVSGLAEKNQDLQRDVRLLYRMRGGDEQLTKELLASNKALEEANVALQEASRSSQAWSKEVYSLRCQMQELQQRLEPFAQMSTVQRQTSGPAGHRGAPVNSHLPQSRVSKHRPKLN